MAFVILGVFWSGMVLVIADQISPLALRRWSDVSVGTPRWVVGGEGVLIRGGEEGAVLGFTLDERGLPAERLEAERAEREDGRWILHNVKRTPSSGPTERLETLEIAVPAIEPMTLAHPQQLTGAELARAGTALLDRGLDNAPYRAESGLRVATALACAICIVFGGVLGVVFGKQPSVAGAIAAGIGLFYWMVLASSWALAMTGAISEGMLATAPTFVLGVIAAVLYMFGLRR